jgi:hypothetical protein
LEGALVIAYKFLRSDGTSVFTGYRWELPNGGPGAWVEAPIEPCRSGIHGLRLRDLPLWTGKTLWEIELDGEVAEQRSKVVASRGRLVRRIDAWESEVRDAYTRMCADRGHELAQSVSPPLENWAAVIEPSVREGPALLGFVAARIAEELGGSEAYHAERAQQVTWLKQRLRLES